MPDRPQTAAPLQPAAATAPAEINVLIAYVEDQLSIPECAARTRLPEGEVTGILSRHQIKRRPGDTRAPQATAARTRPPALGASRLPPRQPPRDAPPALLQEPSGQDAGPPGLKLSEIRFLTVAEVATVMRVSKMTVYRLIHSGELEAIQVGRSFRIPKPALTGYLADASVDVAAASPQ